MDVQIFLINLKRANERRKKMFHRMKQLNMAFEYFEAIDGQTVSDEQIRLKFDNNFLKNLPAQFTRGAIGASLSHHSIYEKIVAQKIPWALILEDDVILHSDLHSVLQKVISEDIEDQLTLFYYQSFDAIKIQNSSSKALFGKFRLYDAPDQGYNGAAAYLISEKVASRLLEQTTPIKSYADDWTHFLKSGCYSKINLIYPFIVTASLDPSNIASSDNRIVKIINKYKIPVLYWLIKFRRGRMFDKMRRVLISD